MKSILRSKLVELLEGRRDNEVYIEFDGYEIPITGVYFDSLSDQIRIRLDAREVKALQNLIKDKPVRQSMKVANAIHRNSQDQ